MGPVMAMEFLSLAVVPAATGEAPSLPETVVTASRTPEEREFFQQSFRTVPEALANTPGVMVQKTTHGHGNPFIRGFTGRQNLLLVDGVRINNSTWRSGPVQYWNTVDGFAMDRIELVLSQGSVLYGSDALGGTLNVLSRGSGFLEEAPGHFAGGAAHYRFDTNSESHVGRFEVRFGEAGAWGVLLGVSGKDFGDIRDSALGRFERTGYPEQNIDLKIEALLNPETQLTFAHHYLNQDDVWRWHSTVFNDEPWNGTTTGTFPARIYDQERSLTYLRMDGTPAGGPVQSYAATLSYQKSQDREFQDRMPTDIRNQVIDVETYGIDLQLESALAGGSLLWGLDYYRDEIDSAGSRTGQRPEQSRPPPTTFWGFSPTTAGRSPKPSNSPPAHDSPMRGPALARSGTKASCGMSRRATTGATWSSISAASSASTGDGAFTAGPARASAPPT
jgi:hemoglobin/transferrin/lactoferrin receptor protein